MRQSGASSTLLTTVVMCGFLSMMTCPITRFHGSSSSRMFTCAMCPTLSKELGTSDPAGSSFCAMQPYNDANVAR